MGCECVGAGTSRHVVSVSDRDRKDFRFFIVSYKSQTKCVIFSNLIGPCCYW